MCSNAFMKPGVENLPVCAKAAAYSSGGTTLAAMCEAQLPNGQNSLFPWTIGISPALLSLAVSATNSSQVAGGLMPFSSKIVSLYQMVLVTSSEIGMR